jgi:excisionase family DNA binding protein
VPLGVVPRIIRSIQNEAVAMNYLTVHEVATRLRVSDLTIRRWIWSGRLPAERFGRLIRIREADVGALATDSSPRTTGATASLRPGSAAALLEGARQCGRIVEPGDIEELERLIAEGFERPGETGDPLA